MRISDWSSDVCSSDLRDTEGRGDVVLTQMFEPIEDEHGAGALRQGGEGREKCRHLLAAGGDAVRIEDIEVPFRFGKRGFAIALADHELADAIYQQILCDAKNIDIDRKSTRLNSSH